VANMGGLYRGMGSFVAHNCTYLLSSLQSAQKCDGSRSGSRAWDELGSACRWRISPEEAQSFVLRRIGGFVSHAYGALAVQGRESGRKSVC
jgi:hypothetical protein